MTWLREQTHAVGAGVGTWIGLLGAEPRHGEPPPLYVSAVCLILGQTGPGPHADRTIPTKPLQQYQSF